MGGGLLIGLASAVIGGIITLVGVLLALPKIRAEARKLDAEASSIMWQTLRNEIDRLTQRIAELEKGDRERELREAGLEKENRQLRAHVKRLEGRVSELETILKIGPLPPDMQAALDKLNDIPGAGK